MSLWPQWRENPFFFATLNLLLLSLVLFALSEVKQSHYETNAIGMPEPMEHMISVEGEGRVSIVPDIATVSLGVETSKATVEEAQTENARIMNELTEQMKALGIDAKDLQTQYYSVYEDEYWNPETGEYVSTGWIVSQQLSVKIRETEKVSEVLAVAGRNGVTNVYGPDFEVDDPESQLGSARDEAIADARMKAQEIARSLGVELGEVVAYNEYSGGGGDFYRSYSAYAEDAVGGAAPAPAIEAGSNELTLNVSVTYLIGN